MPRVNAMIGLVSKLDSPYITVHQDRCQLVRNRNADCLRCASVCTSGCIAFDGEVLTITPENCIGCGTCATICPTCCLEAHHPNDAELLNECHAVWDACEGTVTIACASSLAAAQGLVDETRVVRVECLGRVEESALTVLAAEGAAQVVLVHGDCSACPHQSGRVMLEQVIATERELLTAWNCALPIRVSDRFPGKCRAQDVGYDASRRAAFEEGGASLGRTITAAAGYALEEAFGTGHQAPDAAPKRTYPKVMDDGTLPHFVPDRRERLLDALAELGEPDDVMISTRLWGHVIIDTDRCKSCRMCATFCPTGALRPFGKDDGSGKPFGVEHYPGDCVKCRCCENICPVHAIEISEEVFARDMLAGMTDAYEMRPVAIKRSSAHTILEIQKTQFTIPEVYER